MLRQFKLTALLCLGACFTLPACAPVDALNAITPNKGYEVTQDVYKRGPRGDVDIYTPETVEENSPVIVFFYGGGWNSGEKSEYKFVGQAFASEGYITLIPNYRIHPDVKFPRFVEDGAKAVRHAVKKYPDRPIVMMGHSAGGHIVDLLALNSGYFGNHGVDYCNRISGVVSLAGPVGIVPMSEEPYITIFPQRFTGMDAPLNVVEEPSPEFFLAHGKDDTTVYPQNSQALATAILSRGGKARSKVYDGHDHIDTVKNISVYFDGGPLKSDIIDFIDGLPVEGPFCH